jgi:hypothetical protein
MAGFQALPKASSRSIIMVSVESSSATVKEQP